MESWPGQKFALGAEADCRWSSSIIERLLCTDSMAGTTGPGKTRMGLRLIVSEAWAPGFNVPTWTEGGLEPSGAPLLQDLFGETSPKPVLLTCGRCMTSFGIAWRILRNAAAASTSAPTMRARTTGGDRRIGSLSETSQAG